MRAPGSQPQVSWFEHPVGLGSFRGWLRLVADAWPIAPRYLPRVAAIALTTLATAPLRQAEAIRFRRAIAATAVPSAPIFLLGHWRTGTTHLHNLLAQDPQFGFVSTFQAMAPAFSLAGKGAVRAFLQRQARRRHPTREIDNIPLDFDAPQEESFALANLGPLSSLHVYTLPQRAREIFTKYGLLEDLSPDERRRWVEHYLHVLKVASLRSGGRRLVLKDPCHTARIRFLLELFPDARFVHIVRNPYHVLPSVLGVWRVVLPTAQLQDVSPAEIEAATIDAYERMMRRYLAERDAIPDGQLVEVRYEHLEREPMGEVARIYRDLDLPGWGAAAPRIAAYLASIRSFVKNEYRVDAAIVDTVNRHWGFALDEWNYPRL